MLGIDAGQIRPDTDALGQIDDHRHVRRLDSWERLMHDREHVNLALVGERHRTELFALAAFRACDAFWIEINYSALLALDAFEMRLGRQFQPWNDRARSRVSSSLSLLSHEDPPDYLKIIMLSK